MILKTPLLGYKSLEVGDLEDLTSYLQEMKANPENAEEAFHHLLPKIYKELKRIANRHLHGVSGTIQGTVLVNEAYLKLSQQNEWNFTNRSHFFAVSSTLMRRILIDYIRSKKMQKRGGTKVMLAFDEEFHTPEIESESLLLSLDGALENLSKVNKRAAQVVEMKFFAGLELEEISEALNISIATIKRDWLFSKAWLFNEMNPS